MPATTMNFAVIKTGGKQYKVAANDVLKVEKLLAEPGDVVVFDQVLMVGNGEDVTVGAPLVARRQRRRPLRRDAQVAHRDHPQEGTPAAPRHPQRPPPAAVDHPDRRDPAGRRQDDADRGRKAQGARRLHGADHPGGNGSSGQAQEDAGRESRARNQGSARDRRQAGSKEGAGQEGRPAEKPAAEAKPAQEGAGQEGGSRRPKTKTTKAKADKPAADKKPAAKKAAPKADKE